MDTGLQAEAAIVFPAISPSGFADVGKFMVLNPVARRLVAVADRTLGGSLLDDFRTASGDYSRAARIAFLVNCVAVAESSARTAPTPPSVCAGPSFGGTPAAVYGGALDFAEAVWATAESGRLMHEYFAREHTDVVTQSFARVPEKELALVLAELAELGEWYDLACQVDHDFHMVSLRESRLEWLRGRLRSVGGLPLDTIRPPMHAAAFAPLRATIEREVFAGLRFTDPLLPVVSDHDGSVLTTAAAVRTTLLDAATHTVRWPAVVDTLRGLGVRTVTVAGPDSLWGRVGCMTDSFQIIPLRPETALRPRRQNSTV
jgi:[acyl-carrier-protein] S-malonyltransferase